jgi:NAD(P)H-dependent flavin oxidoreductase YrpB (nitropropane dioxygenase family)
VAKVTKSLGIKHPVVLAPMGSLSGGMLASAVAEAGNSLEHALRAVEVGADIVVAHGKEAGGQGLRVRSTMPLIPLIVDALNSHLIVLAEMELRMAAGWRLSSCSALMALSSVRDFVPRRRRSFQTQLS